MDINQKIVDLIEIKGPVIPSQISKEVGLDILMTSARLSELSSDGKLRISNLKVGGTPLYYLPNQVSSLQNFFQNLHDKEKTAFNLLKEKKILRDKELEPVIRVALRQIKDFAVPLQVTHQDRTDLFWKWYLLNKEEASSLIKSLLDEKLPEKETEAKEEIKEKEFSREIKKPTEEKQTKKFIDQTHSFLEEINPHLKKNRIIIKSMEIIRKNSEIDFILEIPSGIGTLEYYCKAKNKKRISEGDLSSAYVQGQLKKLPVLFLAKGELTKRAKEMLNKEFKNININNI